MRASKRLTACPSLPWRCSKRYSRTFPPVFQRSFAQSIRQLADDERPPRSRRPLFGQDLLESSMHREILGSMSDVSEPKTRASTGRKNGGLDPSAALNNAFSSSRRKPQSRESIGPTDYQSSVLNPENEFDKEEDSTPHHFHIYTHRHNTHITLTKPNRDPIISVSAGNIGIRKGKRGEYDSAYQLTAYVLSRIQDQGLLADIQGLELVLRGFGKGRDAVTKALMGSEGRIIRNKIVRVTDSTRLKFGGTRSRKPRRL